MAAFDMWIERVAVCIVLCLVTRVEGLASIEERFGLVTTLFNFANAELECRNRGFDGLATLGGPEDFNYVIELTKIIR